MIERCPTCGSADLVDVEIAENAEDDLLECEECGHQTERGEL